MRKQIAKRAYKHHGRARRGSMSLEVLTTLGVTLPIALVGLNLARLAYRSLYLVISTWVGSPYF
jgi:hypothetical protein